MLYANRTFAEIIGIDSSSLVGKKFVDLLSRGSSIFFETQFSPSLLLRKTLEEISLEIRTDAGERLPVLVNAVVHEWPGEQTLIHMSVFITKQRKKYEGELLRARREFEETAEIVRRSSDGIVRLSASGVVESWNNGAQQIFGYSSDDAKGKSLRALFPSEYSHSLDEALHELHHGVEVYRETLGLRKQGDVVDISISLTPHMEAPGTLVGFSAIVRDTTDRKTAERALLQSEKLASVGRLASSIAHEINNPLESVTNLLYILAFRVTDPEIHQFVVTAQEELARVSHIATHTLRFHKQSSSRTRVELQSLAASVLALYRARLQSSNVKATSECTSDCHLVCFEGELRQILVNLVSNSYDALRGGGRLVIRARESRDWKTGQKGVRVLVADDGTGMSAESQRRLFEAFYSTKGIGGTGLGLWITRDLVAKNGGAISVRSSSQPHKSGTLVNLFFAYPDSSSKDAP